jgi:hypothetical protein
LWCRLIISINVATFGTFKRSGLDLLAGHRSDFPSEYLRWIEEGPVGAAVRPLAWFGEQGLLHRVIEDGPSPDSRGRYG